MEKPKAPSNLEHARNGVLALVFIAALILVFSALEYAGAGRFVPTNVSETTVYTVLGIVAFLAFLLIPLSHPGGGSFIGRFICAIVAFGVLAAVVMAGKNTYDSQHGYDRNFNGSSWQSRGNAPRYDGRSDRRRQW